MQSKRNRSAQLSEMLLCHELLYVSNICKELSISVPTLKRYIKELSFCGWETSIKKNTLTVKKTGQEYSREVLWKPSDFTSWKILSFIYISGETPRSIIQKRFCCNQDANHLSIRALDIHLNKLVKEKRLTRIKKGRVVLYYSKPKRQVIINNVHDIQNISVALENTRHMFGDAQTDRLKYWLQLTAAEYQQREKIRNTTYDQTEIISFHGYYPEMEIDNKSFSRMKELCENRAKIKIITYNNSSIQGNALKCAYHHEQAGTWLFLYTGKGRRKYQVVRVDKAKSYHVLEETPYFSEPVKKEIHRLQTEISEKLKNSFGLGLDEEQQVELIFFSQRHVLEKAMNRLKPAILQSKVLDDGSYYFKCQIVGTGSFLQWIRKFGRSVIILSPEWMRNQHRKSAYKVLKQYGEVIDEPPNINN